MTEVSQLVIPAAQFDALAGGHGDAAAMRTLHEGQTSLRLLLLGRFLDHLRQATLSPSQHAMTESAVEVLLRANKCQPTAVADVLTSPHVRTWLGRAESCLPTGVADACTGLVAFAAAVAIRAGIDFELELIALQQTLFLPTFGSFTGLAPGAAFLEGSATRLSCLTGATALSTEAPFDIAGHGWQPLRRIGGPLAPTIILDDLDPDRDCYQWQPLARLSDPDTRAAAKKWETAFLYLSSHYPEYVPAVQALRALVPLAPPAGGASVSAASSSAFGAIALSIPDDTASMVELIIHESQHVRLHGLLDLVDLYDPTATRTYYTPWRSDSRPIGPFLQGIYAHLGVCDFWRRHRHLAAATDRPLAELEFALWRIHLPQALTTIAESPDLTGHGRRFVAGMTATIQQWCAEPLSPQARRVAQDVAMAHRLRWEAVRSHPPLPSGPLRVRFATTARQFVARGPDADNADLLLASGNYLGAAEAFRISLDQREDLDDRIGLAIAQAHLTGQSAWHS